VDSKLSSAIGCKSDVISGWNKLAHARKADSAKATRLLTPTPPQRTGRLAWDQNASVNSILSIFEKVSCCDLSTEGKAEDEAQLGVERNKCNHLGIERQLRCR